MRPKKKRNKHSLPDEDLNITSLMDILTTLLFFILMVMSMQKFSVLESTSLTAGEESKDNKPTFTLQVTVHSEKFANIWLGPIDKLDKKMVDKKSLYSFLKRNFEGKDKEGFSRKVEGKDLNDVINKVQTNLIAIKKGFPNEMNAVLSFRDKITYQQMIDAISGIRELGPKREGFIYRNLANQREKSKVLFPQVIIAEEGPGV